MTLEEQVAIIDALPPLEQDALSYVCTGLDGEVPPELLRNLMQKGLILKRPSGRYDAVSYWVHYAWCEWCSRQEEAKP